MVAGVVLFATWAVLTALSGGIDLGDGLATRGATAAMLAMLVAAPFTAWAVMRARDRAALRSGPALLAIAGIVGLVIWSAVSIAWALAGDLAWTEANRMVLAALALLLGISLGALVPRAQERFALALTVAAAPVIIWALLARSLPTVFGSDYEPSRLQAPVGYWNALALVCVLAVPGLLWWAGRGGADERDVMGSAAGIAVAVTTLVLTYSRGGLLALMLVLAIVIGLTPGRVRQISAVIGGLAGAILPAWYGLTTDALTDDALIAADRSDAGLGLLWRVVAALIIAGAVAWAAEKLLSGRLTRRRVGAGALVVLVTAVAVAGGYALAKPREVGNWISERSAEIAGTSPGLANTPGRLGSLDTNQRVEWWGEAARSVQESPVIGEGAGSFPLVHLRERATGEDRLNVRQPHNLVLEVLSGLGVVGLALLACLLGGIIWAVVRAWQDRAPPATALPLAVVAAFLLQSQLDWTWTVPALTMVAMAAGGVIIAAAAPGPAPPGRALPRPAVAAAWAVVPFLMLSALLPWWSQEKVSSGNRAISAGQPAVAVERAAEASALNPLAIQPWLLRARASALQGDPVGLRDAARRATEVQPDNPAGWSLLAIAYGDTAAGAAAWRRVLVLSPQDSRARLALEATE
jgi:O-antigen ligase